MQNGLIIMHFDLHILNILSITIYIYLYITIQLQKKHFLLDYFNTKRRRDHLYMEIYLLVRRVILITLLL